MFLKSVVIFVVILCGAIIAEEEIQISEEIKEIQPDYNQEWRAVDYFPPQGDTSGWVPHENNSDELPKRRRLRKRKRRPLLDSDEFPIRRRIRPFSQLREPWEEFSAEEVAQKSYKRRRVLPAYTEEEIENISEPVTEKNKVQDLPVIEFESKQNDDRSAPNLKLLLKQTGSLSLSEILQQKNLSLAELLKGNQHAISALTERSDTTSTEEIPQVTTTTEKYRRLPPSIGLRKFNRNYEEEQSQEGLTSRETLEAQRKRLSLLHSHKENKLFGDVAKYDVVTEQTTEKRVFIPSNPKYTTVNFQQPPFSEESAETQEAEEQEEITIPPTTTTPSTTTKIISSSTLKPEVKINFNIRPFQTKAKPKFKPNLPITSAKLGKFPLKTTTLPPAIIIDVNEVLNSIKKNKTDEPFKMSLDLEPTTTAASEKLKHVTAKEEIMEILKDPIGRENLSRILKTRNMTIKELVEQRERGSSQVHLADIFHNKTREPEPAEEPFVGTMVPENPSVFRQPKQVKPVTTQRPEIVTITSFPTYKIETDKTRQQTFLPIWKELYPNFFPEFPKSSDQETTTPTENELQRLEVVENQFVDSSNDRLNVNLHVNEDEEFINFPSGVKSAIIASLAIIGLSLLVFITILVIFKWNQKQKQRLSYSGSFSGSKIKSPILETVQRRTLRSLMTETLGRKKNNYYKTHLQSMQDNIWDVEKKNNYNM